MSAASRNYLDECFREQSRDPEYHHWLAITAKAEYERINDMNINDVFPSNFLKASDLHGRKLRLTISEVRMEKMGQEEKPVLYFEGKDKGLVLNKTKAGILSAAYSPETEGWRGKEVAIYPTKVSFQGQMVDAIGVEAVVAEAELNDDVPF